MRTFLFFIGSVLGSIAFQVSVALYPETLRDYAWLVKYVWIAWAVVWFIWLIIHPAFLGSLVRRSAAAPAPAGPQNPTQTVNVNVGGPHDVRHAQPPPRAAIPRARPNLICLGPQSTRVRFFDNTREQYFHRNTDQNGLAALIVCFRNEPKGARAEHVRVNVVYRDKDGKEIGTGIARASWLGEHMDMMDFHVGDSHCAVLVVRDEDVYVRGLLNLSNLTKERRRTVYGDVVETRVYPLSDDLKTIEVRVLSGDDLLMEPVRLDFSLIGGLPTATMIQ